MTVRQKIMILMDATTGKYRAEYRIILCQSRPQYKKVEEKSSELKKSDG